MKSRTIRLVFISAALLALVIGIPSAALAQSSGGGYVVNGTAASGGGSSSGGSYQVGGSAGQPAISNPVTGTSYAASSGYWRIPVTNLVSNGEFTSLQPGGLPTGWGVFGLPADPPYQVTSGVFEFYRQGGSAQGVALQNTGHSVGAPGATGVYPLEAIFRLGNSSNVRKRAVVLIHRSDFGDLHLCSFWLPPNTPLGQYIMRTHTTQYWDRATFSLYASSADGLGWYRLDSVLLREVWGQSVVQTTCTDPNAPAPGVGADGANLLNNGDFSAPIGSANGNWGTFGQIAHQVTGGVFEFYRLAGDPAGAVLQNTGTPIPANAAVEARFDLGNSSATRMRTTILLHAGDFSDLQACTFWVEAGAPMQTYVIQTHTTSAWGGASLSIYPSTVAASGWLRLDNVTMRRRPTLNVGGTGCFEPGSSPAELDEVGEFTLPALLPTAVPLYAPEGAPVELPVLIAPAETLAEPESAFEGTTSE